MTDRLLTEAWQEGHDDFHFGNTSNPYPPGSTACREWQNGFMAARMEERAEDKTAKDTWLRECMRVVRNEAYFRAATGIPVPDECANCGKPIKAKPMLQPLCDDCNDVMWEI